MGDVVSVLDEDGGVYYAQLRGFLQDQYMNKSAVITWLLPTTDSPPEGFDPGTFILGVYQNQPNDVCPFVSKTLLLHDHFACLDEKCCQGQDTQELCFRSRSSPDKLKTFFQVQKKTYRARCVCLSSCATPPQTTSGPAALPTRRCQLSRKLATSGRACAVRKLHPYRRATSCMD